MGTLIDRIKIISIKNACGWVEKSGVLNEEERKWKQARCNL